MSILDSVIMILVMLFGAAIMALPAYQAGWRIERHQNLEVLKQLLQLSASLELQSR